MRRAVAKAVKTLGPVLAVAVIALALAMAGVALLVFRRPAPPAAPVAVAEEAASPRASGMPASAASERADTPATASERERPGAPLHVGRGVIIDTSGEASLAGLEAQRLTLDLDNSTAADAYTAFSFATSNAVEINATNAAPNITLHLHDVPYLAGLLELRRQVAALNAHAAPGPDRTGIIARNNGMSIINIPGGPALMESGPRPAAVSSTAMPGVRETVMQPGLWCVAGPFAVDIVTISRELNLGGQPARRAVMNVEFMAEPQMKVLRFPRSLDFTTLLDAHQKPITAETSRPMSVLTGNGLSVSLNLPEAPGDAIAVMRGTASIALIQQTQPVEDDALDSPFAQSVNGLKIEITPPEAPNRGAGPAMTMATLRIRYSRADMAADQWALLSANLDRIPVHITDAAGQPVDIMNSIPVAQNANSVQLSLTLRPAGNGDPHQITIDVPTEIREVRVPFEFQNVALP